MFTLRIGFASLRTPYGNNYDMTFMAALLWKPDESPDFTGIVRGLIGSKNR